MRSSDTVEWGYEYTDGEVAALHEDRQPRPVRPFALSAPAPRQGQTLNRRSARGDKWCPYCQTVLNPATRHKSCDRCRPLREAALERSRDEARATPVVSPQQRNYDDIQNLLDAIDEMARVVGVASSMRYRNGGMKAEDAEDMLVACKDVMVATDPLRRRLRTRNEG